MAWPLEKRLSFTITKGGVPSTSPCDVHEHRVLIIPHSRGVDRIASHLAGDQQRIHEAPQGRQRLPRNGQPRSSEEQRQGVNQQVT